MIRKFGNQSQKLPTFSNRPDSPRQFLLSKDQYNREIYTFGTKGNVFCRILFKERLKFNVITPKKDHYQLKTLTKINDIQEKRKFKGQYIVKELKLVNLIDDISIVHEKYTTNLQEMNYEKLSFKKKINIVKILSLTLIYLHQNNTIHTHLSPFWVAICQESQQDISVKVIMHENSFTVQDLKSLRFAKTMLQGQIDQYTSPQAMMNKIYGIQGDIWSLGVVFYQLMFGKITDFNIRQGFFRPAFPKLTPTWLTQVLSQMLDPEAKRRLPLKHLLDIIKPALKCQQAMQKILSDIMLEKRRNN